MLLNGIEASLFGMYHPRLSLIFLRRPTSWNKCLPFSVLIAIPLDVGMAYNLDRAIFFGISDINASYLLSIAGISNSFGKIFVGQLTDCLRSRIFSLTFVLMLTHAVSFAFSDYFRSWLGQAAENSAFGFFNGAYSSTSAVHFKYAEFNTIINISG